MELAQGEGVLVRLGLFSLFGRQLLTIEVGRDLRV